MDSEQVTRTTDAQGYVLTLRGSKVLVRELALAVFDIRYQGIGHGRFVTEIQRDLTRRIREGHKVSLCVDAGDLVSYESDFRRLWTKWFSENRGQFHQVPILFRSALVRMGINVVNPLIGNMILAVSHRAAYDEAVKEAVLRAAQSRVGSRAVG